MDETHSLTVFCKPDEMRQVTAICNSRLRVWWNVGDGKMAFMYQVHNSHYASIVEQLKAAGFEYIAWELSDGRAPVDY